MAQERAGEKVMGPQRPMAVARELERHGQTAGARLCARVRCVCVRVRACACVCV